MFFPVSMVHPANLTPGIPKIFIDSKKKLSMTNQGIKVTLNVTDLPLIPGSPGGK